MEIQISGLTKRSISLVSVVHSGEPDLVFNAAGYSNAKPGALKPDPKSETGVRIALFEEINEFIQKLPKKDQVELYDCYASLDSVLSTYGSLRTNTSGGPNELFLYLNEGVKRIYEIIRFEDLREYIVSNPNIRLPPELSDEYVTSDKITPLYKDRTYRLQEYIDLVAVAMGLRFMIPIWGAYLPIASNETATDMKEYHAYRLLQGSRLAANPTFDRLETYVRANLDEGTLDLAIVFKHMSSEEVPIYLMALAIIRKLSVAPLSAEMDSDHLMKIIHNYATGNASRLPAAFGGHIRRKTDPDAASSEDNSSVLCVYKMKEQVSAGDLTLNEVYIERFEDAALAIEPNIDLSKVVEYVTYAKTIEEYHPKDCQTALAMWVSSTVIPACMVDMFDNDHLLITMGICQSVLHHWGFPQLAILLTARAIEMEDDEQAPAMIKTNISSFNRDQLAVISPYLLPESKRSSEAVLSPNPAVRGIDLVSAELFKNDWEPRCPKELAALYERCDITRRLEVSPGVREELASLLVKINQHDR